MSARARQTQGLLVLVVLSFFVYWASEWTFLITQLSFMADLGFARAVAVLASSVVLVMAPLLLVTLGCALLWIVPSALHRPVVWSILCIPVAIQSLTLLMLFDNFSYTMFSLSIKGAEGSIWLYRVGIVVAFAYLFMRSARWLSSPSHREAKWRAAAAGILLVSLVGTGIKIASSVEPHRFELVEAQRRPNIIFLASDGVPSKRLSAYGAPSETTPFLKAFKNRTLFFSNAFANSGASFPSTISMFTGRSPFTTKTFFRHNPLRVEDSDRHLPAILNQLGYSGIQVADRMYVNSLKQNMTNSFSETFFVNISWIPTGLYHDVLFDLQIFERSLMPVRKLIGDGYQWIAQLIRNRAKASAPADVVKVGPKAGSNAEADAWARKNRSQSSSLGDQPRVDLFLSSLETLPEPFYAHLHLAETHVAKSTPWERFDDTVRASDAYFEQIVSWLERREKLDNTLIIISSDHSRSRKLYVRVPLMIYFPKGEITGVVDSNVQLLDLAPTILSYLGQPIPDWMEGESLLPPDSPPGDRSLFGFFDRRVKPEEGKPASESMYSESLGIISLIRCDQWFYYSIVEARILGQGRVETDTPSCQNVPSLSRADAESQIQRYLEEHDVSASDMPSSSTKLLK